MILADRTQSENEEDWVKYIPIFSRIIECWSRLGFVRLFQGAELPVYLSGEEVDVGGVPGLLGKSDSWAYGGNPRWAVCVVLGDRDLVELEDGMCT